MYCERLGQIFALANGDRVKANQRGKIAFVVDMDKKHTAEQLLKKLTAHHKDLLIQVFSDAVLVVYHLSSIQGDLPGAIVCGEITLMDLSFCADETNGRDLHQAC